MRLAESGILSLSMPTMDELEGLYKKGAGKRNMTALLKTTGWGVWSGERRGSEDESGVRLFGFILGSRSWYSREDYHSVRGFAVRSRSDGADDEKLEGKVKPKHTPPPTSYVAYANGIVKDTKTGLEWKAGPDKDMNWNEAKSWVQSLNLDGGGWRMPSMDELESLYKDGAGKRNMTPLLKTTGWAVWSGERRGFEEYPEAGVFGFGGSRGGWDFQNRSNLKRAFAVRSRNDG